jgi:hypothetical protein
MEAGEKKIKIVLHSQGGTLDLTIRASVAPLLPAPPSHPSYLRSVRLIDRLSRVKQTWQKQKPRGN